MPEATARSESGTLWFHRALRGLTNAIIGGSYGIFPQDRSCDRGLQRHAGLALGEFRSIRGDLPAYPEYNQASVHPWKIRYSEPVFLECRIIIGNFRQQQEQRRPKRNHASLPPHASEVREARED